MEQDNAAGADASGDSAVSQPMAMKIIAGALMFGLGSFFVVVLALSLTGTVGPFIGGVASGEMTAIVLTIVLIVMALTMTPLAFIFRKKMLAEARNGSEEMYGGAIIIPFALLESYGLFAVVVFLMTGEAQYYAPFVLLSLGCMAAMFPRASDLGDPAFTPPEQWR